MLCIGTDFHISLAIYAMRFVVKMVPFEARFSSLLTHSKLIGTIFEFEKSQCEACQASSTVRWFANLFGRE